MSQRPDARPETTPEALPLDLLPPLDRDSQISRPNPPGGEHRPVLQPEEPAAGTAGARHALLPTRLLIGKDGETRSIWPVHLAGWRALGWEVLTPVLPAAGESAATGRAGEPEAELESELEEVGEAEGPEPQDSSSPPLVAEELPEEGQPDAEGLQEPPQSAEPLAPEATPAMETPDFAAMTKAEIIAFCSASYGISLDGAMTKAELVEEAAALHASAGWGAVDSLDLPCDLS